MATDEPIRTRGTPLEELHRTLGAKLGPFGGWLMPIEYGGVLPSTVRSASASGCSTSAISARSTSTGASALDALQGLLTNDLRKVDVGRAQYHHLLNDRGGVEEDLFVYRLAEERWFVVPNASNKDKVVTTVDPRPGPRGRPRRLVLPRRAGPAVARGGGQAVAEAVELPFRGCRRSTGTGAEVVLARTGYTGERGYELFADGAVATGLWDALATAGAAVRDRAVRARGA